MNLSNRKTSTAGGEAGRGAAEQKLIYRFAHKTSREPISIFEPIFINVEDRAEDPPCG